MEISSDVFVLTNTSNNMDAAFQMMSLSSFRQGNTRTRWEECGCHPE
jgi:hypothetical protein